jgi:hypothetical protein
VDSAVDLISKWSSLPDYQKDLLMGVAKQGVDYYLDNKEDK